MRLHVVLGSGAGDLLREVLAGDRVAVCRDPFTEGPCRFEEDRDPAAWLRRRRAWWTRGEDIAPADLADLEAPDAALVGALGACAAFDEIVIWSGDDLAEQLLACWVASLLTAAPARPPVSHARPPATRLAFTSSRLLSREDMRSSIPRPVVPAELEAAAAIWRAYTNESPAELARLVAAAETGWLADQLAHLLPRFPDARDGLTIWERRLLERLREHPDESTAMTIGSVLGAGMDLTPDYIGDGILFDLLLELGERGLLTVRGDGTTMRATQFALTDLGREVLEGRVNRVTEVGFDRWIGGTHLQAPGGTLWWFDGGRLVPTAPPIS